MKSLVKQYLELKIYDTVKKSCKRSYAVCAICTEYIEEAKNLFKNCIVPIALGIKAG